MRHDWSKGAPGGHQGGTGGQGHGSRLSSCNTCDEPVRKVSYSEHMELCYIDEKFCVISVSECSAVLGLTQN